MSQLMDTTEDVTAGQPFFKCDVIAVQLVIRCDVTAGQPVIRWRGLSGCQL